MHIARSARAAWHRLRGANPFPAGTIHFLHVGKAAGTQMWHVIAQVNESRQHGKLIKHAHPMELHELPNDQEYFFSTREPAERFKSGFYSRLRKRGSSWSMHEKLAFERFPHANDLAESLFQPGQLGRDASAAMRSIRHCSRNLVDWFRFCGHMFEISPPIWIIRQENFAADLDVFLKRIGHVHRVKITSTQSGTNANDYRSIPPLSDDARANLRQWYSQDYEFLNLCDAWMNSLGSA